jgi:4-amino-4-deoxy-L-arabinose transferase-like glycosyltransferase
MGVALTAGAVGQWLIGSPPQTSYVFTVPAPERLLAGLSLLAMATAMFAAIVRLGPAEETVVEEGPDARVSDMVRVRRASLPLGAVAMLSGALAAGLLGYLVMALAREGYRPPQGTLFLAALVLGAVPFAVWDRLAGVRWWRPLLAEEMLFLALAAGGFALLNGFDATHWYYSAIGDEYPFYEEARRIAEGGLFNPFQQGGIYDDQPVLSSALQALGMLALGADHFGWKMTSVLVVAATLPFFYLLTARLWGRRAAVLATVLLASSHTLFGYAHTGYNNVQALPISVASFWLFFAGTDRRSALLVFLAAVVAGLGFYTIYTGRIAAVALAVFFLAAYRLRPPLRVLAPSVAGGLLMLAPLFAFNGWDIVGLMFDRTVVEFHPDIVGDRLERALRNIPMNLIVSHYNVQPHHYVTGSMLDPASAVLAALGAGVLLTQLPRRRALFLASWWGVGMLAVGVFNPYPYVSLSRLHYLMPCYALAAGVALHHMATAFTMPRPNGALSRALPTAALAGTLALVLGLNLHRFYIESPPVAPIADEAVAVRAVRSHACDDGGRPTVVGGNGDILRSAFRSYQGQPLPPLVTPEELGALLPALGTQTSGCIVLLPPANEMSEGALAVLRASGGADWRSETITDYSGTRKAVVLFRRPNASSA